MGWRQVVVLWVACVALGGAWLWTEPRVAPEVPDGAAPAQPATPAFLDVPAAAVAGVRLERPDRRLVVRRDGAYWRVVEPADAVVPSDLVSAFVQALLGAREIARVPARPEDLAGFGLGDDAARVTLEVDGTPGIVVLLGGLNPPGTAVYARREGADAVVLIGRDVRSYEDLLFGALPAPAVPADAARGDVG